MMTTAPMHEAIAAQHRTDEARRAELRRTSGVTEPEYGRFPSWLRPRVNALGLRPHRAGGYGCHNGWHAAEALERHVDDDLEGRLFDHHGRLRGPDGDWLLVSEPYLDADDPRVIAAVQAVADLLLLQFAICPASWWNPPHTIRIAWWPVEGQDEHEVRRELRAKTALKQRAK